MRLGFCKSIVRTSACEGHDGSEGLITHEGTRITDPRGTYKLGEAWKFGDQVWAYWTADATTASLGKVVAVGTMTLRFHQLMFFDVFWRGSTRDCNEYNRIFESIEQ